jgi:hypothetical protein
MERISSRSTFFSKKIFPVLLFGFLAVFVVMGFFVGSKTSCIPLALLIIPFFMALFGYGLMRKLIFDLMDEVYDGGDRLIVRNGGVEDAVPLANIINVNHVIAVNPTRIVLTLRQPCRFGKKIAFSPRVTWSDIESLGFSNTLADTLVARVDAVRIRGGG